MKFHPRQTVALPLALLACISSWALAQDAAEEERLIHVIRFGDYESGSIEDWLQQKGFIFERDAKKRDRIDFDIE